MPRASAVRARGGGRRLYESPLHQGSAVVERHPSDAEVITCQQNHLRREASHLFHEDALPRSTRTVLFPTPRRSRPTLSASNRTTAARSAPRWKPGRPVRRGRRARDVLRSGSGVPLRFPAHPRPTPRRRRCTARHPASPYGSPGPLHQAGLLPALTLPACGSGAPSPPGTTSTSPAAGSAPAPPTTTSPTGSARVSARYPSPRTLPRDEQRPRRRARLPGVQPLFFSCTFYITDFTHLPELRRLRAGKAEQPRRARERLRQHAHCGSFEHGEPELPRQEIQQIDELVGKCEADISQHHGVFMLRMASMSRP